MKRGWKIIFIFYNPIIFYAVNNNLACQHVKLRNPHQLGCLARFHYRNLADACNGLSADFRV